MFAGAGGTRIGFEAGCQMKGMKSSCVFTSEIKESAIKAYKENFGEDEIHGDIKKIPVQDIPKFDYLVAGFPCQAFSFAGKRRGFEDSRGDLFFEIVRILKKHNPTGFLLENVEGLLVHNNGKTLKKMTKILSDLGYNVNWKLLTASDFGIPQVRKRLYILGNRNKMIEFPDFKKKDCKLKDVLEDNVPLINTNFTKLLLKKYALKDLPNKSIKDKRGGNNNIHSWDIDLKGKINKEQKIIMTLLLKKRRLKKFAELKNITWMDGMPLTLKEIKTFYDHPKLQYFLDDLTKKKYLKLEHPKNIFVRNGIKVRLLDKSKKKGYNIVAGKLSFPISKILDVNGKTPTIVATEAERLAVATEKGIRRFTIREYLRLFGFPEKYNMNSIKYKDAMDLIGNTVIPPVIKKVTSEVLL